MQFALLDDLDNKGRKVCCKVSLYNKNSSGDEIANVNFFYNIAHVEASAYAH